MGSIIENFAPQAQNQHDRPTKIRMLRSENKPKHLPAQDLRSFSGTEPRPTSTLRVILYILLLMDTAESDKLYSQQGILLVQTEGFVITVDTTVNVIYTDGISGSDQIQDCIGKSIDLLTVRNRFDTMAVQKLNANEFNFITEKQPEQAAREKPAQQLLY